MRNESMKMKRIILTVGLLAIAGSLFGGIPESTEIREEPKMVEVVTPVVPSALKRFELPGKVDVEFRLDDEGRPHSIKVVAASHDGYADSVVNALRQWRFESGLPENRVYRLPVRFN